MSESEPSPRAAPSSWIVRFAGSVPNGGTVLDIACGSGRHAAYFLSRGHPVVAVDRHIAKLGALADEQGLEAVKADLEGGNPWPFPERRFAAVVVTNYLHRPLLSTLVESVAPGGVLLYETFARGNEGFAGPSNPNFLLRPGELLEAVRGILRVRAYEDLILQQPRPAAIQRIFAERESG